MEFDNSLMFLVLVIIVLFPYVYFNGAVVPLVSFFVLFLPLAKFSRREIFFWISLTIIILGYAVGGRDISQNSISLTKSLIVMLFIFSLMSIVVDKKKLSSDNIISLIIWVGVVNAAFSISTTLIVDFRVIYEFIAVNPKVFTYPIPRYPGFVYDGFSYLSVFYCLVHLICMQMWCDKKISNTRFMFTALIMFSGIMIAGRFGMLVAILGSCVLAVTSRSIGMWHILFFAIAICSGVFVFSQYSPVFSDYLLWNMTAMLSLVSGDFYSDSSLSDILNNHFVFIWESSGDFLIGTFDFGYQGSAYTSDVGWVRLFNGFGFFGIISVLLTTWFICRKSKYLMIFSGVFLVALFKDWYFMFPYYFWSVGFALYFSNKADVASR